MLLKQIKDKGELVYQKPYCLSQRPPFSLDWFILDWDRCRFFDWDRGVSYTFEELLVFELPEEPPCE